VSQLSRAMSHLVSPVVLLHEKIKPDQAWQPHVMPLYGNKSYIYLGSGVIAFQCWSGLQEPTAKVTGIT
jgi:hypothetical protein